MMPTTKESKAQLLHNALHACRVAFYYSLLFSFISNLMLLMIPMYSLQVLDRVISSASLNTLLMLTLLVLLALTCLSLIQAVRSSILIRLGNWLDQRLAPLLFAHGVALSAHKRTMGSSQYLQDLNHIKNFITGPAMSSLLDAPWSVIFIGMLFLIHPSVGLISVFGGIVLLGLAIINELATKPALDAAGEHQTRSMHYADTAARNAEAVEAMGMLNQLTQMWREAGAKSQALQTLASNRAAVIAGITRFIRQAIQIAVTGVGAYYVLKTEMSVGGMIAAGILVGRALSPFETAITSWKGFVSARKSRSRLIQTLEQSPLRPQGMEMPEPQGRISMENVYYVPPGQKKPTLSGVSFVLEPGETLAIIGPSAAGKSTITKLLAGVWKPASGHVRLDSAEVYSWGREQFGRYIGYLPQDVELFAGSVKTNIARMNPQANDESVVKAAQDAHVHELVLYLPEGYETDIGTDGSSLSAGQRQRIALARAFYGSPKLLILDEPNASLDNEGDIALLKALQAAKLRGITTVVVSHRPTILQVVDKVMVLNQGKVAEFGSRDEVVAKMQQQAVLPKAANQG